MYLHIYMDMYLVINIKFKEFDSFSVLIEHLNTVAKNRQSYPLCRPSATAASDSSSSSS